MQFAASYAPVSVCSIAGKVVSSLGKWFVEIGYVCPVSAGFAGPGRVMVTLYIYIYI